VQHYSWKGYYLIDRYLTTVHDIVTRGLNTNLYKFAVCRALDQVALLVNPANPSVAAAQAKELQGPADALGVRLTVVGASNAIELEDAFASPVRERIEALQLSVDPLFGNHIDQIVALATRSKIPTIYPWREFTAAGGLMNYGSSIPDAFRQVGVYTGQILNGADPAEMPVQQPTRFELVVNLKTAKELGLTVPPTILARADEVIE